VIFVSQAPVVVVKYPPSSLCPSVPQDTVTRCGHHFFTTFLARNDFTGGTLDLDTIRSQFQSIPSLYHAAIAVGAIDLRCSLPPSVLHKRTTRLEALNSYRASIIEFQKEIQCKERTRSNGYLWTTFFLGLFEVGTLLCLDEAPTDKQIVDV
jgi:hypothetical protein